MSVIVTVTCRSHEMKLCTNSAPRDHLPMSGTVAGRGRALLPAPRGWNYPARDVHVPVGEILLFGEVCDGPIL